MVASATADVQSITLRQTDRYPAVSFSAIRVMAKLVGVVFTATALRRNDSGRKLTRPPLSNVSK
ncbi:hypothetical protein [Amycolatopsis sp. NPDC003861]